MPTFDNFLRFIWQVVIDVIVVVVVVVVDVVVVVAVIIVLSIFPLTLPPFADLYELMRAILKVLWVRSCFAMILPRAFKLCFCNFWANTCDGIAAQRYHSLFLSSRPRFKSSDRC